MEGFWIAAGGALVGAVVGFGGVLLLESIRQCQRRKEGLAVLLADLVRIQGSCQIVVDHAEMGAAVGLLLEEAVGIRGHFEESTLWYTALWPGYRLSEAMAFYDRLALNRALLQRMLDEVPSADREDPAVRDSVIEFLVGTSKSAKDLADEVVRYGENLRWTDWLSQIVN